MAGFFDTLFSGGAEKEAADKNRALTTQYGTDAQGYLKTGYDTGVTNLNKAVDAYNPLATLATGYNAGGSLWQDALGINGPQGNANATSAFQAGPGYQFQFDQGMDALNRRRAAGGMLNSGNADVDAIKFGQGTANQEYQKWLQNLQQAGQTGVGLSGAVAGGQAQGYGNLSNLAEKYAGNQTGVIGNQLSSNVNSNNQQAAGEAAGAKNLLNAGMSLASLAMGAPGLGSLGSGAALGSMQVGNQLFPKFG